ncbi:hypothetical protein KAR91_29515 [Candidatus Pacearchaeota archaeon]|nr:hypothetical protein [Candidatus Pacearchaeota archaeon]
MAEEKTTEPAKTQEPTPEQIKIQEDAKKAEIERLKAEQKQRELVEKKLKECDFKEVDDLRYSFVFDGGTFVFRVPILLEKTQIKLLLSQITSVPGSGLYSATYEIEDKADFHLLCSSKLFTHTTILLDDAPDGFDANKLGEGDAFEFGTRILFSESEFIERKKKALVDEQ